MTVLIEPEKGGGIARACGVGVEKGGERVVVGRGVEKDKKRENERSPVVRFAVQTGVVVHVLYHGHEDELATIRDVRRGFLQ